MLIFVGGHADSIETLPLEAEHYCPKDSLCSCYFTVLSPKGVQRFIDYARRYSDPGTPSPVVARAVNDGIEESLGDGNSVIHYHHAGKWVTLEGMD